MKGFLYFFLKIAVASGILYWMIATGKLDLLQTKIFIEKWKFFVLLATPVFLITMLLQNLRWWIILKCFKIHIKFYDAFLLTWIGNFFSSILPGLISGDVIKGLYLKKKTHTLVAVYTTLIFDRLLGLFGLLLLFLIASTKLSLSSSNIISSLSLFSLLGGLSVAVFIFFICFPSFSSLFKSNNFLRKVIGKFPKKNFLISLYQNLTLLRQHKLKLLFAVFLSILIHLALCLLIYQISTFVITENKLDFWQQVTVIPLGLVITAIPISPAGLGVGHIAFENLYNLLGSSGGANLFNLFIINQVLVFLLGFIPFLFYKKSFKKN